MGIPQDVGKGLDLFRTLVYDPVVEAALLKYEGAVISIPVVGSVVEGVEMDIADAIYNALSSQVILASALFVSLEHRQAFATASIALQQVAVQYGIHSPQFDAAHAKEKDALKKFGQFSIAQPGILP